MDYRELSPKVRAYIILASAADSVVIPGEFVKGSAGKETVRKEMNALSKRMIKQANTIYRNEQVKEIFAKGKEAK